MSSYGLWLSATGMQVSDHRQARLANNMANVETTGFKYDQAVVRQRLVESRALSGALPYAHPVLDELAGGVNVGQTYQSFAQGPIEHTGRALDVAIDGDGFFVVSDGTTTRYTRDGEFTRDTNGELVLAAGEGRWKVLSESRAPILINEKGGPVAVSEDGTIRQGKQVVDSLALMTVQDKQSLRKVGGNMFEPSGEHDVVPAAGRLVPGAREKSNFDVVQGLASMIEASRAYQLNAKMIQLQDDMTGFAVSRIPRVA